MRVLKVELEGLTTSFRYPHFLVGRQPSLSLPPPSTIYGHISSALGEFPAPESLRFGYSFRCAGKVDDLESQHLVRVSSGKFKGIPKNLEGNINPTLREVLLFPKLTLYIAPEESELDYYLKSFRSPRYPVALGRSQDLASYTLVKEIELEERESGYFEGTLLPNSYRRQTGAGTLTQMPRFINYENRREVAWEMYLMVENLVHTTNDKSQQTKAKFVWTGEEQPARFWVDPESPLVQNRQRIVTLHSFTLSPEDFDR